MGTKKLRSNAYEDFSGQKQGDPPMLACVQKKKKITWHKVFLWEHDLGNRTSMNCESLKELRPRSNCFRVLYNHPHCSRAGTIRYLNPIAAYTYSKQEHSCSFLQVSKVRKILILNTLYSLFSCGQRGHFSTWFFSVPQCTLQNCLSSSPLFPHPLPSLLEVKGKIKSFEDLVLHSRRILWHFLQWHGQYVPHTVYFCLSRWQMEGQQGKNRKDYS